MDILQDSPRSLKILAFRDDSMGNLSRDTIHLPDAAAMPPEKWDINRRRACRAIEINDNAEWHDEVLISMGCLHHEVLIIPQRILLYAAMSGKHSLVIILRDG